MHLEPLLSTRSLGRLESSPFAMDLLHLGSLLSTRSTVRSGSLVLVSGLARSGPCPPVRSLVGSGPATSSLGMARMSLCATAINDLKVTWARETAGKALKQTRRHEKHLRCWLWKPKKAIFWRRLDEESSQNMPKLRFVGPGRRQPRLAHLFASLCTTRAAFVRAPHLTHGIETGGKGPKSLENGRNTAEISSKTAFMSLISV